MIPIGYADNVAINVRAKMEDELIAKDKAALDVVDKWLTLSKHKV